MSAPVPLDIMSYGQTQPWRDRGGYFLIPLGKKKFIFMNDNTSHHTPVQIQFNSCSDAPSERELSMLR